jgi:hypothetical protein
MLSCWLVVDDPPQRHEALIAVDALFLLLTLTGPVEASAGRRCGHVTALQAAGAAGGEGGGSGRSALRTVA